MGVLSSGANWGQALKYPSTSIVMKILKQCHWQNLLSFQRCNSVLINNGEIVFKSELVPSAKDTLAPLVVKILKQCYWKNLLSFQKREDVLQTMGVLSFRVIDFGPSAEDTLAQT